MSTFTGAFSVSGYARCSAPNLVGSAEDVSGDASTASVTWGLTGRPALTNQPQETSSTTG
jgi:hypothetical protein